MDFNAKRTGPLLLSLLYFFLNSVFLPEGLLYTAILTPFFLWWLYQKKGLHPLLYFFFFTLPFVPVHWHLGIQGWYYFRSWVLFFSSIVFAFSLRHFLKGKPDVGSLFSRILVINFALLPLMLVALAIPWLKPVFWYVKEFSPGIGVLPRLRMLTYEASYYSLLLVPIALYFLLRLCVLEPRRPLLLFLMVAFPLAMSLSFGVLAGILLTMLILMSYCRQVILHKPAVARLVAWAAILGVAGCLVLWKWDPGNPLVERIENIFSGKDTSFRGRTYESFVLAWRIAKQKSVIFGCGPGQAKVVGVDVFLHYYGYLPSIVRIPNTLADTLATYGLAGLCARLALTIYLFFRTRVWCNYYQLAMFTFIFIYQFTGSFMTNIVEYVIWVFAFTPVFREFDCEVLLRSFRAAVPFRVIPKVRMQRV